MASTVSRSLFRLFYLVEIRHRHLHSDFRARSEALDAISV
jgi:hypothetical protein